MYDSWTLAYSISKSQDLAVSFTYLIRNISLLAISQFFVKYSCISTFFSSINWRKDISSLKEPPNKKNPKVPFLANLLNYIPQEQHLFSKADSLSPANPIKKYQLNYC